ncbi:MAG: hypothetical protein NVS9B9_02690 [Ktedonobacteraceae bacterium]
MINGMIGACPYHASSYARYNVVLILLCTLLLVTAYHHFLMRLAQQVYALPLYGEPVIMTLTCHVQNITPNPNQTVPTWHVGDWRTV